MYTPKMRQTFEYVPVFMSVTAYVYFSTVNRVRTSVSAEAKGSQWSLFGLPTIIK